MEWTSHEYFDAALKAAEEGRSGEAHMMWVLGEMFHADETVEIEAALRVAAEVAERQHVKRAYRQNGRIPSCPMAVSMALVGSG